MLCFLPLREAKSGRHDCLYVCKIRKLELNENFEDFLRSGGVWPSELCLPGYSDVYCAFHKYANSKVQKPPSQLHFSLPSIIITIKSNGP